MGKYTSDTAKALIDQWYGQYSQYIYQHIKDRLDWSNQEDVQDLLADVFVRALRSLKDQPEVIEYPRSWLRKFADNVCAEFFTYSRQLPTYHPSNYISSEGEERSPLDDLECSQDDQPEYVTEKHEVSQLLNSILEEIPLEQKTAVLLHYQDGIPFEKIAELHLINRSSKTIADYAHKGIENLKGRFNELGY